VATRTQTTDEHFPVQSIATLCSPTLQHVELEVRLLGDIRVVAGASTVTGADLPGPIGRHLLTRLVIDPFPVSRTRLVDDIWGGKAPRSVDSVLNATLSRLRTALDELDLDGRELISSSGGSVNFKRPKGTVVDVELAHHHIDFALRDLRTGDHREAARRASIAYSISRRPLLTGIEREWLDIERDRMHHVERRSLGLLADVSFSSREFDMAVQLGRELVRIAPYDERAHRNLMNALRASGNPSGAAKVERDFTDRLNADLGVAPSPDFFVPLTPSS